MKSRVKDLDHSIQINSVHAKFLKLHFDLYLELMCKKSPLIGIYLTFKYPEFT